MDKLWSVLNNQDLFGTEHYETAFIYFNFVIDFELDYKDTYEDIQAIFQYKPIYYGPYFCFFALILKPWKQFALKMHQKYKFEDFLNKVFKWFLNRKERDEDGNPLVDDSPMIRSINLLNIVADKLMGNSPTLCSAVIKNTGRLDRSSKIVSPSDGAGKGAWELIPHLKGSKDTLLVYTCTMQWPKNDGNKLDDDPTMTKFMVGVLARFNNRSPQCTVK